MGCEEPEVTITPVDQAEGQVPGVITLYVPGVVTLIDLVVAPFDHLFTVADDDVKVTLPPGFKFVDPITDMVGVVSNAFTTTVFANELDDKQPSLSALTV